MVRGLLRLKLLSIVVGAFFIFLFLLIGLLQLILKFVKELDIFLLFGLEFGNLASLGLHFLCQIFLQLYHFLSLSLIRLVHLRQFRLTLSQISSSFVSFFLSLDDLLLHLIVLFLDLVELVFEIGPVLTKHSVFLLNSHDLFLEVLDFLVRLLLVFLQSLVNCNLLVLNVQFQFFNLILAMLLCLLL